MADNTTVKAIRTNIITILSALDDLIFEDLSTDPQAEADVLATLDYNGTRYENTFGNRKSYAEATFTIQIRFRAATKNAAQEKAIDWTTELRGAFDGGNSLNIGDLSASTPVSWVEQATTEAIYEQPIGALTHELIVRYVEE